MRNANAAYRHNNNPTRNFVGWYQMLENKTFLFKYKFTRISSINHPFVPNAEKRMRFRTRFIKIIAIVFNSKYLKRKYKKTKRPKMAVISILINFVGFSVQFRIDCSHLHLLLTPKHDPFLIVQREKYTKYENKNKE